MENSIGMLAVAVILAHYGLYLLRRQLVAIRDDLDKRLRALEEKR